MQNIIAHSEKTARARVSNMLTFEDMVQRLSLREKIVPVWDGFPVGEMGNSIKTIIHINAV